PASVGPRCRRRRGRSAGPRPRRGRGGRGCWGTAGRRRGVASPERSGPGGGEERTRKILKCRRYGVLLQCRPKKGRILPLHRNCRLIVQRNGPGSVSSRGPVLVAKDALVVQCREPRPAKPVTRVGIPAGALFTRQR